MRLTGVMALLPWLVLRLGAQGVATTTTQSSHEPVGPYLRVATTAAPIRLDARFAEPVGRAADSIADFRQREPLEGAPATERTVVKIVRDAERLYVAVRAY